MPHARAKELYDIQIYINSRLDKPMVLHGDQEKYSEHTNDNIVVFMPDGKTDKEYKGKAEIVELYRTLFEGRRTGGKDAVLTPAGGLWQRSGP